jgi:phage terminase large subunit-like protein
MSNTGYLGKNSPDRLDAMVWALTDLMLGWAKAPPIVVPYVHSVPRAMPGSY